MNIRIFAIDKNGEREEITDLYWFEENGVHWFDDDWSPTGIYKFVIEIETNDMSIVINPNVKSSKPDKFLNDYILGKK